MTGDANGLPQTPLSGPGAYFQARRYRVSPNAISCERIASLVNELDNLLSQLPPLDQALITPHTNAYVCALRENLLAYRNNMVLQNTGLVGRMVHGKYKARLKAAGVPLEDAIQEGCCYLARAVELFDQSRGLKFSTYAAHWIQHALNRLMQKDSLIIVPEWIRSSIPEESQVEQRYSIYQEHARTAVRIKRLDDKIGDPKPCSLGQNLEDRSVERNNRELDARLDLNELLECLSPLRKKMVELYYLEGLTYDEVASALVVEGFATKIVSRERIRQVLTSSMEKVKEYARKNYRKG
jgi:RNA polymerase sigma factor (sigma-70 family)